MAEIGIQTWGSEGDIRPFLALAAGLAEAGHEVTVVITSVDDKNYQDYAQRFGFTLTPVASPVIDDSKKFEDIGREIFFQRNPITQAVKLLEMLFEPCVEQMVDAALNLCNHNDIVIGHFFCYPLAIVAEETATPYINVLLMHNIIASRYVPPAGFPNLGWGLNTVWWRLIRVFINHGLLRFPNRLRQRRGLPQVRDVINEVWLAKTLNLIAVSPSFCRPQKDWPTYDKVCGFFNLPDDATPWEMPESLIAFLQNGEPPVYMTFGSLMPLSDEERQNTLDLFVAAADQGNCRAILQVNEAEAVKLSSTEQVYYLTRAPHDKVFPSCAAVVHHGGAGTTQSATRAGVPSIVVAHITEQQFWGLELRRLGVAPRYLQRRTLTARKLAARIREVLRAPSMKTSAAELGCRMGEEQGVKNAVTFTEKFLSARGKRDCYL